MPTRGGYTNEDILKLDLPIKFGEFIKLFPWPTLNSLRKICRESKINGLSKAFKRFGNKETLVYPGRLFDLINRMDEILTSESSVDG